MTSRSIPLTALPASAALHITVPMPMNISNGSHSHHMVRHKQKLAYWKALDMMQAGELIPKPPRRPLDGITLDSVMHLARQMDVDNAMRRHKWVMDWLKTRGYIVDDSPKHLTWASFPEQHIRRDGNYRIELTLQTLHPIPEHP